MRKRVMGLALVGAMALSLFGAGTASAAGTTTLNVVHGIPGLDVAVCVDGVKAIKNFNPGEVVAGIELPSGRYDLAVVAKGTPCTAVVLGADNVGLWAGKNNTVVANLNAKGYSTKTNYITAWANGAVFNSQPVKRLRLLRMSLDARASTSYAGQITEKFLMSNYRLQTLGLWEVETFLGGHLPQLDLFETRGGIPYEVPFHWWTGFNASSPRTKRVVAGVGANYGEQQHESSWRRKPHRRTLCADSSLGKTKTPAASSAQEGIRVAEAEGFGPLFRAHAQNDAPAFVPAPDDQNIAWKDRVAELPTKPRKPSAIAATRTANHRPSSVSESAESVQNRFRETRFRGELRIGVERIVVAVETV